MDSVGEGEADGFQFSVVVILYMKSFWILIVILAVYEYMHEF